MPASYAWCRWGWGQRGLRPLVELGQASLLVYGDSPRQLALAILADYLGDNDKAVRLSEPFMKKIVANLDNDWRLTGADIDAAIRTMGP